MVASEARDDDNVFKEWKIVKAKVAPLLELFRLPSHHCRLGRHGSLDCLLYMSASACSCVCACVLKLTKRRKLSFLLSKVNR